MKTFIKFLIGLFCLGALSYTVINSIHTIPSSEDESSNGVALYQEVLDAYVQQYNNQNYEGPFNLNETALLQPNITLTYGLYDIDHNGIDELIINGKNNLNQGAFINTILDIYTFDKEEIIQLIPEESMLGERIILEIYDDQTLRYHGTGSAVMATNKIYKFNSEGNALDVLLDYSYDFSQSDLYTDNINHLQLTETEFNQLLEPYTNAQLLDLQKITEWQPFISKND